MEGQLSWGCPFCVQGGGRGHPTGYRQPAPITLNRGMDTLREKKNNMANNKLFVGGLAWATDDNGLQNAFEKFGAVREAKVIMDRDSGRSRGFGFVTFENGEDAQEAIKDMDGADLDGRSIRVNEANEKPRGGGGGGGGGGRDRGANDGYRSRDGGGETPVTRRGGRGNW